MFKDTLKQVPKFYLILGFAVSVYLFYGIIFDYTINWVHPEAIDFARHALKNGHNFQLQDLLQAFNVRDFDASERPRFFSNLIWVVNTKLRVFLFDFIPFHPSLSLTWIFSYLLSPLLLLKCLFELTKSWSVAVSSTCLYLFSMGFLSGTTQYFHAAKSLTNFAIILEMFLAAKIDKGVTERKAFLKKDRQIFTLLLLTLLYSSFLDETAFFGYVMIPILFPNIFFAVREKKLVWFCFVLPILIFCLVVTFVAPPLVKVASPGWGIEYSFWSYAFSTNSALHHFDLSRVFLNASKLFGSHYVPDFDVFGPEKKDYIVIFVECLYFVFLFTKLDEKSKKWAKRFTLVFGLFVIFQTAILTRRYPEQLQGAYYWGMISSIFLSILTGILVGSISVGTLPILNKILLVVLLCVSIQNFLNFNWKIQGFQLEASSDYNKCVIPAKNMAPLGRLDFSQVLRAWQIRQDKAKFVNLLSLYPKNGCWLYWEASPWWP